MQKSKMQKFTMLALAAAITTAGTITTTGLTTSVWAGDHSKGGRGSKTKWMDQLNLSAAQKARIAPIMKASSEKRKALWNNTSLTPEQKKARFKAIKAEMSARIKPILTAEQNKKMEAFASKHKRVVFQK